MFTIPVGNFVKVSTVKRPSANSPTTNDFGTLTNPSYAYDTDPSTCAAFYSGINPEGGPTYDSYAYCVYSGFSSFTVLNAKLYVTVDGTGDGNTIMVSLDNGVNYPFQVVPSTKLVGSDWVTVLQTAHLSLPNAIDPTQIKVKVSSYPANGTVTSVFSTLNVYDIYIEQ